MLDTVAPVCLGTIERLIGFLDKSARGRLGSIDVATPMLTVVATLFAPTSSVVASKLERTRSATASPSSSEV
jgi:hypothetical protein